MTAHANDLEGFEAVYRRHVDLVIAGDLKAVLADMAPGAVPAVFEGVETPAGEVRSADVVDMSVEGDRAVGAAVYRLDESAIGLRSGWRHDGTTWLADELANFDR